MIEQLSKLSGMSDNTAIEELLPLLSILHSSTHQIGNPNQFSFSYELGLTAEEHVALTDIPSNRQSAKEIYLLYNQNNVEKVVQEVMEIEIEDLEGPDESSDEDDGPSTGQMTLF